MIFKLFHQIKFRAFLIVVGSAYLLFEIYYVTAFINTYSLSYTDELLDNYKDLSRLISSFGIAFSTFVFCAFFLIKRKRPFKLRSLLFAALAYFGSYAGIEKAVNVYAGNASPPQVLCNFLGGFAKKNFLRGEGDAVPLWNSEASFTPFEHIQIGMIILPAALCSSPQLLREAFASRQSKQELYEYLYGIGLNEFMSAASKINISIFHLNVKVYDLYAGHNKVANLRSSRYKRGLARLKYRLNDENVSDEIKDYVIATTNNVHYKRIKNPSYAAYFNRIAHLSFDKDIVKKIDGLISPKIDYRKKLRPQADKQIKRDVNKMVAKWTTGKVPDFQDISSKMRLAVKAVTAPLILICVSGLAIILSSASIVSMLIPSFKGKGAYVSMALKFPTNPIVVIVLAGVLIPVTPTEKYLLANVTNPVTKVISSNLLKSQFLIYPLSIKLFAKFGMRPVLWQGRYSKEEKEKIALFNKGFNDSFTSYKYTTPALRSAIFYGIGLSNANVLRKDYKDKYASIVDYYENQCRSGRKLSCIKSEYLESTMRGIQLAVGK